MLTALHCLAVIRRGNYRLLGWALLIPLYWAFHSISAWRAAWQLFFSPFHWEKTPHGLSSQAPATEHLPAASSIQ